MATYTRRQNPDQPVLITAVAAGDKIYFRDVLGKDADKVQVYAGAATDTVQYRLNNLQIARSNASTYGGSTSFVARGFAQDQIKKNWLPSDVFESVGSEFEVGEMLTIASMEITGLTLASGTTVSIICW